MFILWLRKSKAGDPTCPPKNDPDSFTKHNEDMKSFRQAHPKTVGNNPKDMITPDGHILAAPFMVKLAQNTQN